MIFWDVMSCNLVIIYWSFRGTSVNFYHTTWCHISEDSSTVLFLSCHKFFFLETWTFGTWRLCRPTLHIRGCVMLEVPSVNHIISGDSRIRLWVPSIICSPHQYTVIICWIECTFYKQQTGRGAFLVSWLTCYLISGIRKYWDTKRL